MSSGWCRGNGRQTRGEIHLGDLICALGDLPWEDQGQAQTIAACLGFGLRPHPKATPSELPHRVYDRRGATAPPRAAKAMEPVPKPPVFVPPAPRRPPPLPENVLPSRLTRLPGLAPPREEPPDWLADVADAFPPCDEARPLARATLLPERTARHVLSASLATDRLGPDIDLPGLIASICRLEPLRRLPRRHEITVAEGCQLLLDYSGTMVPFWEDLAALGDQVREVVGRQTTRVYSFDARPTRARHWTTAGDPEPWEPDGRPVLAATDLRIQGRGHAEPSADWPAAAARCLAAGSRLILLIPWPEERWPRAFPANATLIHWGPRTTAGMVRRQTCTLAAGR